MHLKQFDQLLTKLRNSSTTFKMTKWSFIVPQINIFGHIVSAKGIQADKAKIRAIKDGPSPTNG